MTGNELRILRLSTPSRIRPDRFMSQIELAKLLDVSRSTIIKWENDVHRISKRAEFMLNKLDFVE